jgi:predicted esterase
MHGGGGTTKEMNDQQWRNQIGLYEPDEGIYMAPRAPTDSWNMWHQSHVDSLFSLFIELADVFEDINTNRVYLTGYSAGGDGTYQLAPRMADQLAAAAMMAGHPNDASPLGLRNLPFALHMGAEDAAYDRNIIAAEWGQKLDELQQNDPDGYIHDVQIHENMGHWMQRKDTVAIEWMAQFDRNPYPEEVVWKQSSVTHDRFYWLGVPENEAIKDALVIASYEGQTITIEKAESVSNLHIYLNDEMVDLDKKVTVKYNGEVIYSDIPNRTIAQIWKSLTERNDPNQVFFAQIEVSLE